MVKYRVHEGDATPLTTGHLAYLWYSGSTNKGILGNSSLSQGMAPEANM